MGLRKGQLVPPAARLWLLPAVFAAVALALQAGGASARQAMQFDREMIASGQLYRLLTGHAVHLGWSHFVLNLLGLLLVWYLVGRAFRLWQWLLIVAASICVIDLGFWTLLPALSWYVGLSGLLHGLFAAGIVGFWPARRTEALIFGFALVAKLVYESFAGPLPGSVDAAGGAVITEAHLFGAIGGAFAGLIMSLATRESTDK